ncbi:MAG: hypothetical protein ABR923_01350 [Terracidiphilus sp.]
MDKPQTPAGQTASNSPWPEDSGSGQGLGATGIFGAVNEPEPAKSSADASAASDPLAKWLSEPQKPPAAPAPPPAAKDFAEPVVHKVVFGGGAAESSPELLDRMRQASAERAAVEKPSTPEAGNKGSGGFTELLRTLSSEPAAPPAPVQRTPSSAEGSGFTSLLRTLETPVQADATYKQEPYKQDQYRPAPPPSTPAPGGFTELLRATSADSPEFSNPAAASPAWGEPAMSTAPPGESKPGAFTQMFGAFTGGGSSAAAEPVPPPRSNADSFTSMLSLEQQSDPVASPYQEEHRPLPGPIDYGQAQRAEIPTPGRDPFAPAPLQETPPGPPAGAGMGITRLIQMLDEPSKTPSSRFEPAPVSPPSTPEPGVWTQTFASLGQSNELSTPQAKAPTAPAYPPASPVVEPVLNKPPAPSTAGPSEFTRILDASKMRELSMKGGAAANPAPPAAPPSFTPGPPQSFAPAPAPMPNFQMPAPPPIQMPGIGGMPQPGGFTPPQAPQVPNYPMNYPPPAAGMPSMGGMPQAPGMHMPTAPLPPAPQVPPVKPPDAAAGKTQQLLIIMGVVIIVLLVAILVTVVFLMKH